MGSKIYVFKIKLLTAEACQMCQLRYTGYSRVMKAKGDNHLCYNCDKKVRIWHMRVHGW